MTHPLTLDQLIDRTGNDAVDALFRDPEQPGEADAVIHAEGHYKRVDKRRLIEHRGHLWLIRGLYRGLREDPLDALGYDARRVDPDQLDDLEYLED